MNNTKILLNAAAIKVAAAAKTINRHRNRGDYAPNMGKVLLLDSTFKMELEGIINRLDKWGEVKMADYARALLKTAMTIRQCRKMRTYTQRIDWVADFPFAD